MADKIRTPLCVEAIEKMKSKDYFRVVVFGASNTERYMPGGHWSEVLEVGILAVYGRKFHLINAGYSGNNTREGLARFDRDVASFNPDIVVITFAGNDCNPAPAKFVPEEEFAANLDQIVAGVRVLGAVPILQTYYQMDLAAMEPERAAMAPRYMELIREAASRNQVFLVDQNKYFNAIPANTLRYELLHDPMHVNEYGNMFIGIILLHHLGIDPRCIFRNNPLLPAMTLYDSIAGSPDDTPEM